MKSVKAFFAKVSNYIKNSAWIQPILIVIVIFVILFSLNPLTEGIKSGWTKLTTVNNMETISYKEYIEKVQAQGDNEKMVVVFTQNDCDNCPVFYKSVNEYLKSDAYKDNGFKIYNVSLSTKSSKVKINGVKYKQYKDKTCGLISTGANDDILAKDYIRGLDKRVYNFYQNAMEENSSYSEVVSVGSTDSNTYTFVSTPLIIWYEGGIETRMCNTFANNVTLTDDEKKATPSSFRTFITDFEGSTDVKDSWSETFELTYNTAKSLK